MIGAGRRRDLAILDVEFKDDGFDDDFDDEFDDEFKEDRGLDACSRHWYL